MSEARERRKEERIRRIGEILAQRSGPVVFDEPIRLEAVPGLTEALDSLVTIPIAIDMIHAFLGRDDFDLEGFHRHILSSLTDRVIAFDDLPPLWNRSGRIVCIGLLHSFSFFIIEKLSSGRKGNGYG